MRQNYRCWISYCTLFLSLGWTEMAVAQSPTFAQISNPPIRFVPYSPNPGRPTLGRVGGGSRGNCPLLKVASKNSTLIPLVPQQKSLTPPIIGWSATDKPSLWVYSPYFADSGVSAIVVLRDAQDLTQPPPFPAIKLALPSTPGVMQISLPQPLELQRLYRWFFTVNCDSKDSTKNPQVNGLIGWIAPSQDLQQQLTKANPLQQAALYAKHGFWYDALALLAKEAPSDDWTALLQSGSPTLKGIAQEKVLR